MVTLMITFFSIIDMKCQDLIMKTVNTNIQT